MRPYINNRSQQAYPIASTTMLSISRGMIRSIKIICDEQCTPYISLLRCNKDGLLILIQTQNSQGVRLLGRFTATKDNQLCKFVSQDSSVQGLMVSGILWQTPIQLNNIELAPQCIEHTGVLNGYHTIQVDDRAYPLQDHLRLSIEGILQLQGYTVKQSLEYPYLGLSTLVVDNDAMVLSVNGREGSGTLHITSGLLDTAVRVLQTDTFDTVVIVTQTRKQESGQ